MTKFGKFALTFTAIASIVSFTAMAAAERATKDEAQALVKKAVEYVKTNGADKAYAEFDKKDGSFTDRDLYIVVYDANGKCLAHGSNAKLVGKDLIDAEDADGKAYIKDRVTLAKTQTSFWQEYKFADPLSKKISPKETYCEAVSGTIVCGGIYKQ